MHWSVFNYESTKYRNKTYVLHGQLKYGTETVLYYRSSISPTYSHRSSKSSLSISLVTTRFTTALALARSCSRRVAIWKRGNKTKIVRLPWVGGHAVASASGLPYMALAVDEKLEPAREDLGTRLCIHD